MAVDLEEATMYQCRGFFVFSFFIKSMYFIIYTYVVRTSEYLLSWFKIRVMRFIICIYCFYWEFVFFWGGCNK